MQSGNSFAEEHKSPALEEAEELVEPTPDDDDVVVESVQKNKLRVFERRLKNFRYKEALDVSLRVCLFSPPTGPF